MTHLFLEGVTFGLWNLVGVPMEMKRATEGFKMRRTVTYGDGDRIVGGEP